MRRRSSLALAPAALILLAASSDGRSAPALVMLDPGHGGSNNGARGFDTGAHEKQLTLALARRTASYLRQWLPPGGRVMMTRDRDEYLTLAERVERANAARATLFVSLHLNASEGRDRTGFETFILSREAAAANARRGATGAVGAILADLGQAASHLEAAQLAATVQRALRRVRGRDRDRGVRQAPFDVLIGLRMPGVLVEGGYIDHPVEGRELASAAVHELYAAAIASAIVEHLARAH